MPKKEIDIVRRVSDNPQLAAVISKLTNSKDYRLREKNGRFTPNAPYQHELMSIGKATYSSIRDTDTTMKLLPDIHLSRQILISCIISPKDMTTTEIIYNLNDSELPDTVKQAVLSVFKEYFQKVYDLKPLLWKACDDALFRTGSLPLAVIPENSIDEIINGSSNISTESLRIFTDNKLSPLKKSTGLLGSATANNNNLSLESLIDTITSNDVSSVSTECEHDKKLSIIDNFNVLKSPKVLDAVRTHVARVKSGIPAFEHTSDSSFMNALYSNKTNNYDRFKKVKTDSELTRESIGRPLIMRIPSEAVIPVSVAGDLTKHVGYFVLLDAYGNPISSETSTDYFKQMGSNYMGISGSNSFSSAIMDKVKGQMGDNEDLNSNSMLRLQMFQRAYSEFVEMDLINRLKNGSYGDGLSLSRNDEVYRLMLARSLANQNTQILFMPAELMTYVAFDYNEMGVGKSLLDDMKIQLGLRIILKFANVMASVNNSMTRKQVNIKLDPESPDPYGDIEKITHEIVRSNQGSMMPVGVISPVTINDWLQKACFEFTFENHPGIPDTSIGFEEKSSNYIKPDTDLEEQLRDETIMGFGLSPETVSNASGIEFATTALQNNILLSKRSLQYQERLMPFITDHAKKICFNDRLLLQEVIDIIEANWEEIRDNSEIYRDSKPSDAILPKIYAKIASNIVSSLEISLPPPVVVTIENQLSSFKAFMESLNDMVDTIISSDLITDNTAGEASGMIGEFTQGIKSMLARNYIRDHGLFPELEDMLVTYSDKAEEMPTGVKDIADFASKLTKYIAQFGARTQVMKKVAGEIMEAAIPDVDETASTPGSDSTDDDTGGGFDSGGFDDDDTSLEEPSLEEPVVDETVVDTPPEDSPSDDLPAEPDETPAE